MNYIISKLEKVGNKLIKKEAKVCSFICFIIFLAFGEKMFKVFFQLGLQRKSFLQGEMRKYLESRIE